MLIHKYELTALNIINKNNKIITFKRISIVYTHKAPTQTWNTHMVTYMQEHTHTCTPTHTHTHTSNMQ